MSELGSIEIGQQYIMNRPGKEYTLHVCGICMDKLGKYKITVQLQYPEKSKWIKKHYATAKLVSPQYFFGLTVKVGK